MTHDPVEGARVQESAPTGTASGYEAPEMIVLGSVEELTAGDLNGGAAPSQAPPE
jgi:hypothetical protein